MSFDPNLPSMIGPQPNRWLWMNATGKMFTCIIVKVTAHDHHINLVWYGEDGEEHFEANVPHYSKVTAGTPCWVTTDGGTGYVQTA